MLILVRSKPRPCTVWELAYNAGKFCGLRGYPSSLPFPFSPAALSTAPPSDDVAGAAGRRPGPRPSGGLTALVGTREPAKDMAATDGVVRNNGAARLQAITRNLLPGRAARCAPGGERLRLSAWSLCWHTAAAGMALHALQPMCTTADNKDDVELPGGLTRAGCEADGHQYQPGLAPLLGPALVPLHSLHSSWTSSEGDDDGGGGSSLAAALLGQHGAGEWPAPRVPIRVHAVFLWQAGAVLERRWAGRWATTRSAS